MTRTTQLLCASVAALVALPLMNAVAQTEYGYATMSLSNLRITTTVTNGTLTSTSSGASAIANGSGVVTSAPSDAPQAYFGAAPPAPENSFTKYSTAGGGPQPGNFARGDSMLTNAGSIFSTGATISAVAETFNSLANTTRTGSGSGVIRATFNTSAASIALAYSYLTDIVSLVSGGGISAAAQASFAVTFTITDQHGHMVTANPAELNSALSAPPNGPEIITSGTSTVTLSLAGFTAGDTFSLTVNEVTNSSVNGPVPVASAPEGGSSMLLLGLGAAGLFALAASRRAAMA